MKKKPSSSRSNRSNRSTRRANHQTNRNVNREISEDMEIEQFERFEHAQSSNASIKPKPNKNAAIEPRNDNQRKYLSLTRTKTLVFAPGPAGVGKTWIAGAHAVESFLNGDFERIIITRPAVEAGEKFGFLPGDMDDKYDPWIEPFNDVLEERFGASFLEYLKRKKKVKGSPLGMMRGKTFKNALVILDEAQNVTPVQMKMFLTRIGEGSKVIVIGDLAQKDIPGKSGFSDAIRRFRALKDVGVVIFTKADVVRSDLVQQIVEGYEDLPTPNSEELENL